MTNKRSPAWTPVKMNRYMRRVKAMIESLRFEPPKDLRDIRCPPQIVKDLLARVRATAKSHKEGLQ